MTTADDDREPMVNDEERRAMAAFRLEAAGAVTPTPREAAWTVHRRIGAEIAPCALHERAGDVPSWVVDLPQGHQPRICDDAELVA